MADNSNSALAALVQALLQGQQGQGPQPAPAAISGQSSGVDPKVFQALLAKLLGGQQ